MSKAAQAQAFIAFLRCEAKASEERAASLRATAATIETNATDGKFVFLAHSTDRVQSSRTSSLVAIQYWI
jgi:hypothetical protein